MKVALSIFIGAAYLLAAAPATPHHSFAAEFDISRPMTLTGSVTRIEWTNPHAWFYIDVKSANGVVETWAIEVVSANGLLRRGWTRDTVKVGDVITVEGFGARDGSNTGNASAVIMASTGERLYASSAEDRN